MVRSRSDRGVSQAASARVARRASPTMFGGGSRRRGGAIDASNSGAGRTPNRSDPGCRRRRSASPGARLAVGRGSPRNSPMNIRGEAALWEQVEWEEDHATAADIGKRPDPWPDLVPREPIVALTRPLRCRADLAPGRRGRSRPSGRPAGRRASRASSLVRPTADRPPQGARPEGTSLRFSMLCFIPPRASVKPEHVADRSQAGPHPEVRTAPSERAWKTLGTHAS
jgi:hypothetical protein